MEINNLTKKLKLNCKIVNNFTIKGFCSIEKIKNFNILFYEGSDLNYINKKLQKHKFNIVILNKNLFKDYKSNKILSSQPRVTFIKICDFMIEKKIIQNSLLKRKTLGKNCLIDKTAKIGSNVKIGNNVKIGTNVIIDNCSISDNSIISDNCVIGNTGFGFIRSNNKFMINKHFGNVVIGKNVLIGPITNIERGHIDNTIIKDNVKIDSLVQIGHNCTIDRGTIITAGCILSGNVKVGKKVWMGPKTSVKEKIVIKDNCLIGIGSNVLKNLEKDYIHFGNPTKKFKLRNANK